VPDSHPFCSPGSNAPLVGEVTRTSALAVVNDLHVRPALLCFRIAACHYRAYRARHLAPDRHKPGHPARSLPAGVVGARRLPGGGLREAASPLIAIPHLSKRERDYSQRITALSARVGFEDPDLRYRSCFPVINWWLCALVMFMAADAVVFVAAL
jgi:hypothetical protein